MSDKKKISSEKQKKIINEYDAIIKNPEIYFKN